MRIEIDRTKLTAAAVSIESYLDLMKNCMDRSDLAIQTLAASWEGKDYMSFSDRWNQVTGPDSVYAGWREALGNYASLLRFSEAQYREAQQNALDRASALLKGGG